MSIDFLGSGRSHPPGLACANSEGTELPEPHCLFVGARTKSHTPHSGTRNQFSRKPIYPLPLVTPAAREAEIGETFPALLVVANEISGSTTFFELNRVGTKHPHGKGGPKKSARVR